MTLGIGMLINSFLLHTTMKKLSSQVSHMYHAICHDVNNYHLKSLLVLMTSIILASNGHDTLRPLGM